MDKSTNLTEVSVLAPEAFFVVDAAISRWLVSEIIAYNDLGNLETRRIATSSGSSHHTMNQNRRSLWQINLRAVDSQNTTIQLVIYQDVRDEDLYGQLAAFWEWFSRQQLEARDLPRINQATAQPANTLITNLPAPKRRGPDRAPHNEWVLQQLRLGHTMDELLPEYMQRRGEDYMDESARKRVQGSLTKVIQRARKSL
jgi:hypothetical protein